MKDKKIAVENAVEQLEAQIESFMQNIKLHETVRMQFLEQSAKYMGVYVENTAINSLENRVLN